MRIMQSRLEVFSANMDTFQVSRLWWSYVIPCQENFLHTTTRWQIVSIRPIALKKDGRPFLLKKNYTSFDEFVNEELLLELSTKSLYAHSLYSTHQGSGLMYWSVTRHWYYLTTSSRVIPRPSDTAASQREPSNLVACTPAAMLHGSLDAQSSVALVLGALTSNVPLIFDYYSSDSDTLRSDALDAHISVVLLGYSPYKLPSDLLACEPSTGSSLVSLDLDGGFWIQKETVFCHWCYLTFFVVLSYLTCWWIFYCSYSSCHSIGIMFFWIHQLLLRTWILCDGYLRSCSPSAELRQVILPCWRSRRFFAFLGLIIILCYRYDSSCHAVMTFMLGLPYLVRCSFVLNWSFTLVWTSAIAAFGTSTSCRSSMVQLPSVASFRWRRRVSTSFMCWLMQQYYLRSLSSCE